MKIEGMLRVSEKDRHRLRPFQKRRKYKCEPKRQKFSKSELLEYLRSHNFRSLRQLEKGRQIGDPRMQDYLNEFGKWENARANAFGVNIDFGFNEMFLIKSLVECNAWTADKYREKRRARPDVFPPLYRALEKWGGKWSTLKGAAMQYCFKTTIEAYRKLWVKLGRTPRVSDVQAEGIDLEVAIAFYGSKEELDKTMSSWKVADEGKAGSS